MPRLVVLLAFTSLLISPSAFADARRLAPPHLEKAPAAVAPHCALSGSGYALQYARDDLTSAASERPRQTADWRSASDACPADDVQAADYDLLAAAELPPAR